MLGLSMLLHAWLMENQYGKGVARGGVRGASIAARISPVADPSVSVLVTVAPGVTESKARIFTTADATAATAPTLTPAVVEAASVLVASRATAVLSPPSDPTYYAVGDLDVFPKALVTPDLSAALAATHVPAVGAVRATLLIDEAGVVNAVRGVEASAGDIESATRELLLRTRFTPARNKEGRIVKARVLIALDYDTRAIPASPVSR